MQTAEAQLTAALGALTEAVTIQNPHGIWTCPIRSNVVAAAAPTVRAVRCDSRRCALRQACGSRGRR